MKHEAVASPGLLSAWLPDRHSSCDGKFNRHNEIHSKVHLETHAMQSTHSILPGLTSQAKGLYVEDSWGSQLQSKETGRVKGPDSTAHL